MSDKLKLYTSDLCEPCREVKEMVEKQGGIASGTEIDLVDVGTEEGFKDFAENILGKGAVVPSIFKGNERCLLSVDEDSQELKVSCPSDVQDPQIEDAEPTPEIEEEMREQADPPRMITGEEIEADED